MIVEFLSEQSPNWADVYVAESDPYFVAPLGKRFRTVITSEYAPARGKARSVRREDLMVTVANF